MRPPGNRWSFRHVRELLPTARVRRAAAVASLPVDDQPWLADTGVVNPGGGRISLGQYLAESYTDAFCVLRDGRVVFEWYADGVASDEPHILMSVTKSVTGLLTGVLAGHGLVDPDAGVEAYVPEASNSTFAGASVRHLLDMSVGTTFVEDYTPGVDVVAYRRSTGWEPSVDSVGLHAYLCSIPRDGAHGEAYHYVSPNTDMLGWVLERAAGRCYADLLSHYLWQPAGMEHDADLTVDRFGAARAAGGLCVTVRDMARIGQLVVNDGAGIVPAAFIHDLREGGDPALWAASERTGFLPGAAYRSCWYQPRVDPGVVAAIGIFGQSIYADPARRVVVAKQSSWPFPVDDATETAAIDAGRAIAHALTDADQTAARRD